MGMVDVGDKDKTLRTAKAKAIVKLPSQVIKKIVDDNMPKGNVLETARVAAVLAAKKTSELIPLCHNIELENVNINFIVKKKSIEIESKARATAKTGVEMEAIVACSIAAITIYDMCKMFTKSIEISNIELLEKKGGKSGDYKKR
jgi:cyclic pyranopterin phosphate synthase